MAKATNHRGKGMGREEGNGKMKRNMGIKQGKLEDKESIYRVNRIWRKLVELMQ